MKNEDTKYSYDDNHRYTLREWLFKTRITVSALSDLLDIDRSYVHQILRGSKIPSQALFKRIKEITMGKVCRMEDLKDSRGE